MTTTHVKLEFQHPWQAIFWLWGVSKQDVPEEFYHKFGNVVTSSALESCVSLEAWQWLFRTGNKDLRIKLVEGLKNNILTEDVSFNPSVESTP